MRHPKEIGDESTMAIAFALRMNGYDVYLPFGENTRCDLTIDNGSGVRRVQCKTGRLRKGAVRFRTCSSYAHHANPKVTRRDYHGQIDDFGVYCPELGAVYLIPIDDLPNLTAACLRVHAPRNAQVKNIRLAAAYEIARIDVY
jgi:PD-(D/E)XK endonuclease